VRGLHLIRLPLLHELSLLQMLVFHLRLRLRVRLRVCILLIEIGVIALLHLSQGLTLLLLPCLQLGLLTWLIGALIGSGFRCGRHRLGFRQVLGMYGDRAACAARTYDVRVESAWP
jgi:hypothetical protein